VPGGAQIQRKGGRLNAGKNGRRGPQKRGAKKHSESRESVLTALV